MDDLGHGRQGLRLFEEGFKLHESASSDEISKLPPPPGTTKQLCAGIDALRA
jgi:hypothetical protein